MTRSRSAGGALLVVCVTAFSVAVASLSILSSVRGSLGECRQALEQLASASVSAERAQACGQLAEGLADLQRPIRVIDNATSWFTGPLARQTAWPWLAQRCQLVDAGLDLANPLLSVAWWAAVRLQSTFDLDGTTNTASGVAIDVHAEPAASVLRALREKRETLVRAKSAATRLAAAGSALEARRGASGRIAAMARGAPHAVDALLLLPKVLREGEMMRCLVLLQNNDELRATGGFISSIVVVEFVGPRVDEVRYLNSYDVEGYGELHTLPPEPMARYMHAGVLLFRDGNWSPHFPTSAEVLAALYALDMGEPVDLVVAVDAGLAGLLLKALGPLEIPSHNVTVTSDNVVDTTVSFWESPLGGPSIRERHTAFEAWLSQRKAFGAALIQAGTERVRRLTTTDVLRLADALWRAAERRHVQVWPIDDVRLQQFASGLGVDGAIVDWDGDYVMVIDSNVGWNKVDRNMMRDITYAVEPCADGLCATLTLEYTNLSPPGAGECEWRSRYRDSYQALAEDCYWNYARVLVPMGSELRGATGFVDGAEMSTEASRQVFGGLVMVPSASTRRVELTYVLPEVLSQRATQGGHYGLYVQKQAGTMATRLHLRLASIASVIEPAGEAPNILSCDRVLNRDYSCSLGRLPANVTMEPGLKPWGRVDACCSESR